MQLRGAPVVALIETLEGDGKGFAKMGAGLKLIPSLLEFVGIHASVLLEQDLVPDTIVSSTARRARETALAVAEASQFPDEV